MLPLLLHKVAESFTALTDKYLELQHNIFAASDKTAIFWGCYKSCLFSKYFNWEMLESTSTSINISMFLLSGTQ